jgi:diacylglycerol kinase (ATP)
MCIYILSNGRSGSNKNHVKTGEITSSLLALGRNVNTVQTDSEEHIKKIIQSLNSKTCPVIITVGGDGTLSSAAAALAEHRDPPVLAPFPGGTTNDFCKSFQIPFKVDEFTKMVHSCKTVKIDMARCESRYFINVLSLGHFVDSAFTVEPAVKERFGSMAYYLEGIKKLSDKNLKPLEISWQSKESRGTETIMFMLIANGPSAGGIKFFPAENSRYNEGFLDVIIIKECDILDLTALFFMLLNKSHLDDYRVIHFKTKKISIKSQRELVYTIDGEKGGSLPARVELMPSVLKIIDFKKDETPDQPSESRTH